MKIGLVYTSTTPELIELVNKEVRKQLGDEAELLHYEDPSILSEIREHGYVTTAPAARLISMFMQAAQDGADAILNICSSVGEVADCIQDAARYIGVPIVRIDEEMCRDAVRRGTRIGVMATLPTTLEPTKNTVKRVAREMNREITLVDSLVDGAFGLDQDQFRTLLLNNAEQIKDKIDILLLCQGSMAYCEEYLEEKIGVPVVSSPKYGAAALKEALKSKGVL
ncbi:MAG TPA: aspartate/glutamate racemase family protein [Candidatus Mediterraneibacter excrementigallinarum]|nr:aspartate/glutamate racemase family protein [Candidatus Mediterraneibacter excrementigallinarum]